MAPRTQQQPRRNGAPPAIPNAAIALSLEQLRERRGELVTSGTAINDAADAEERALSDDELERLKKITAEFDQVDAQIEAREAAAAMKTRMAQPQRRLVDPEDVVDEETGGDVEPEAEEDKPRPYARFTGGLRAGTSKRTYGFRSIGEWSLAARKMARGGRVDDRILNAPSTFGGEGTNSDGGFAVPPDFRANIVKLVMGEDPLISRTDQQVTTSNSITLPLDITTPWDQTNGPLAAWIGEGADITPTKPQVKQMNCKANKVAALVPVTDELLEDAPALASWLERKVPDKFNYAINAAIILGDGAGKPMGLLNAPCKVTQTAITGQGTGTVVAKNITQMWGRLYARLRANAVWIINQDVEQQLQILTIPGTSPAMPAWLPPGGFSGAPFATMFGRPIIYAEACSAVGTEGDIILTDLTQYLTVIKAGGMRSDVSIHLYFPSDHTAFRFIMRVGGMSYWPSAIARASGSTNTLSPIITLNSTRT